MCLASVVSTQPSENQTSSTEDSILVEHRGPVAIVTLNRPAVLNALTADMTPRYAQILRQLDADSSNRAIVVTGAGRGFCSGADTSALAGTASDLQAYVSGQSLESLPVVALTLGTPVITAINGPCAGIGFVLAISADFRFVAPGAKMSTTFARLGLVAEYGIAYLLPRLIGLPAATDLLLTGRTITGTEADRIGLARAVEDPLAHALAFAEELVTNSSPSSIATMKRQLLAAQDHDLHQSVDASLADMSHAFTWPDLGEALAARAQKRTPNFPGR